jgi:hypothetical protein
MQVPERLLGRNQTPNIPPSTDMMESTLPVTGTSGPLIDTGKWVADHADPHLLDSYINESKNQTLTQSYNIAWNQETLVDLDSMKPSQGKFLVPADDTETKSMIHRLMIGGLNETEAKQIIAMRKSAFNKALREYKKTSPVTTQFVIKKSKKNNKTTTLSNANNGL